MLQGMDWRTSVSTAPSTRCCTGKCFWLSLSKLPQVGRAGAAGAAGGEAGAAAGQGGRDLPGQARQTKCLLSACVGEKGGLGKFTRRLRPWVASQIHPSIHPFKRRAGVPLEPRNLGTLPWPCDQCHGVELREPCCPIVPEVWN